MREQVYAGSFYPKSAEEIRSFFSNVECPDNKKNALGAIVPHAGYIYSGKTAYKTLCSIEIPETVVIFCPNHKGLGWMLSVWPYESWQTPFGDVEIDRDLSESIATFEYARLDKDAHIYEHSLEVQLPILKLLRNDIKMVAISVGVGDEEVLDDFARHINSVTEGKNILFLASSDMSHYVSADFAKKQDSLVIEALKTIEYKNAKKLVETFRISMCGIYPAYLMCNILKLKGASKGEVIEYTNSGEVTGDFSEVVAYLGMIFY